MNNVEVAMMETVLDIATTPELQVIINTILGAHYAESLDRLADIVAKFAKDEVRRLNAPLN